jgi:alpha-beta hydrolase superfamily lysophospholipase
MPVTWADEESNQRSFLQRTPFFAEAVSDDLATHTNDENNPTTMTTTTTASTARYQIPDPPSPPKRELMSPRGARLATRYWACPRTSARPQPRALAVLVHGYGYHSGYFGELACRINLEGIDCASYDQVCHGYSEPEPGSPSGFVHVRSFDDWVEDVYAALEWAKTEGGLDDNVPTFLLGESFGGLEVLEAARQAKVFGVQLAGVVTSGGLLKVHPNVLPPQPIVKLLSWLAPYYPKLKMPNDAKMEASYDGAFGDPEWARVTRRDSKVMKAPQSTLASVVGVLTKGDEILQDADSFPCPLLAIHAKGDSRVSIEPITEMVDKLGPNRAMGMWVESEGHQLFQDKREITVPIMDAIAGWMSDHV